MRQRYATEYAAESAHSPHRNLGDQMKDDLKNESLQEAQEPDRHSEKGNVLSIVDKINAKRNAPEKIYICRTAIKRGQDMTEKNDAVPYDKDDPLGLTDARRREDGRWECPLTGEIHSAEEVAEWDRHSELVRQQLVREYSKSPLYQAAAAKDPNYWKEFSMGQAHLYDEDKNQDEDEGESDHVLRDRNDRDEPH